MARQYTGYIDENDCMGDSLGNSGISGESKGTINGNSLSLDLAIQSLSADLAYLNANLPAGAISNQLKLSQFPNGFPFSSTAGTNTTLVHTSIHLHSFSGNAISLFDLSTNIWKPVQVPKTTSSGVNALASFPLKAITSNGGAATSTGSDLAANSLYDIYIYNSNGDFTTSPSVNIEYLKWSNRNTPPTRSTYNGVWTKQNDITKRFIGVVGTTTAGTSEFEPLGYGGFGVSTTNLYAGTSPGALATGMPAPRKGKILLQNNDNRTQICVIAKHNGPSYVIPNAAMVQAGSWNDFTDPIEIEFISPLLTNGSYVVRGHHNLYGAGNVYSGTIYSFIYDRVVLKNDTGIVPGTTDNILLNSIEYFLHNQSSHLMFGNAYEYNITQGYHKVSLQALFGDWNWAGNSGFGINTYRSTMYLHGAYTGATLVLDI